MSFLDENGLTYFYEKLKEKFIRTVNSEAPDAHGNVTITNVATADNLTSPDAQASYGTFIYRTSGGSASLSSGEAQLVYIDGNIDIVGRVVENFQITATNDIVTTYSADIWRSQIDEDGTYVFTYIRPTSSAAAASWTTSGTWSYDGSQISMASFGLYPSNVINPSISAVVSGSGITAATVVPSTFFSQITTDSVTIFQYVDAEQETGWKLNNEFITLNTYGITATGTAVHGDTITITSIVGTPNSTLTVDYTAPYQGTINVATPTVFSATGFNQFDKNSMVLTNASFSGGKIIQNTGTYACYCHAKGGVDNGYVAYSESDAILDIGWCANIPTIGADIITTGQSVSDSLASIPFDDDGYVVVIASSTADICIHPKWSGSADTEYAEYVAPSTITIPTQDSDSNDLPTATYGMPKIGAIADRINLDAGTYIQRIGRLTNTSSNMDYVTSLETGYDYDDNYIYYVLPNTITYNIDIDPIYTVNDWGTEEFLGTTIPLSAQLLYGQNLRDKLRTDVVTISAQELTQNQKNQICTNIGAVNKSGDTMTGDLTMQNKAVYVKNTSYAVTNVPATSALRYMYFTDKNDANIGYFGSVISSRSRSGMIISGSRLINDSSVDNVLQLLVDSSGNRVVVIDNAKAAWRKALEIGSSTGELPITIAQGGTGVTTADDVKKTFDPFRAPTAIASNTDLNNIYIPGIYYSETSTVTGTLSNCPHTGSGFALLVSKTVAGESTNGRKVQVIFVGNVIYSRRKDTSSWSSWYKYTGTALT